MIGAGTLGSSPNTVTYLYLWNLQAQYSVSKIQVPMFQYNTMHNGIFEGSNITPFELTSFFCNVDGNNAILNWSTATETNNQGYEVQRNDGKGFKNISFIKGNGTTTQKNNYHYTDKNLPPDFFRYRLKQIDYDGKYNYSNVINAHINLPDKYSLHQNYPTLSSQQHK